MDRGRRDVSDEVLREVTGAAADVGIAPGTPEASRSPGASPRSTSVGKPLRERLGRVPDWGWLAAIVTVSATARVWLGFDMPAPFIFVDELIYSELARSLADTGSFAVRGVPTSGYSVLYPALISPAYWLLDAWRTPMPPRRQRTRS